MTLIHGGIGYDLGLDLEWFQHTTGLNSPPLIL